MKRRKEIMSQDPKIRNAKLPKIITRMEGINPRSIAGMMYAPMLCNKLNNLR